ncbi:MAG: hypothetical protein K2W86_14325 [Sphingomonas sp.]|uniref:hypothetical protein n=1 Tax=Sphingomonas sp. TaxID=28214 RepID=UPI0035A85EB8|nr:hypothetical protein [Sphingomonas sp.]
MSYDLRKWVADSQTARKRSRWTRHFMAAGMLAGIAFAIADLASPGVAIKPWVANPAILVVLIGVAPLSPFGRESWMTEKGRATFDEFERSALSAATTRAYATLMTVMILGLIYFWIASIAGWAVPTVPRQWAVLTYLILGLGLALPVFYAELLVPFPPAEGEDE